MRKMFTRRASSYAPGKSLTLGSRHTGSDSVLAQSTALHPPIHLQLQNHLLPRKSCRVDYHAWAPDPAEVALVGFGNPTTSASAAERAGQRGLRCCSDGHG